MFIYGTGGEISTEEDLMKWKTLWDINDIPKTQDNKDNLSFRVEMAKKFSITPIIWDTKENIKLDKQFIKSNTMKQELTVGEKRVRKTFNPSALKRVEKFKTIMASAIDYLEDIKQEVLDAPNAVGQVDANDFLREVATAQTDLQKASMMGVAAITSDIVFDKLSKDENPKYEPHQQRVIDERDSLNTKIELLGAFIAISPIYESLPHEEKSDLSKQIHVMQDYRTILDNRIKRFS